MAHPAAPGGAPGMYQTPPQQPWMNNQQPGSMAPGPQQLPQQPVASMPQGQIHQQIPTGVPPGQGNTQHQQPPQSTGMPPQSQPQQMPVLTSPTNSNTHLPGMMYGPPTGIDPNQQQHQQSPAIQMPPPQQQQQPQSDPNMMMQQQQQPISSQPQQVQSPPPAPQQIQPQPQQVLPDQQQPQTTPAIAELISFD